MIELQKERRRPLGGIEKSTYLKIAAKAGEAEELAEVHYDIWACMDSKIQLNAQKIDAIPERCAACDEKFNKRFIRRVHEKLPISLVELFLLAFAIGLGIFEMSEGFPILKYLSGHG